VPKRIGKSIFLPVKIAIAFDNFEYIKYDHCAGSTAQSDFTLD
jgi:hypothetical protein